MLKIINAFMSELDSDDDIIATTIIIAFMAACSATFGCVAGIALACLR